MPRIRDGRQAVKGSILLINEPPLQVLPSLAVAIGLNEALFLQQLHYWLGKSGKVHDGREWIYNTLEDWEAQFPFWSRSTLRRTITELKKRGLLLVGNYNERGFDRTQWYSIDYDQLVQIEQAMCSKRTDGSVQDDHEDLSILNTPIPETNAETSQRVKDSEVDRFWGMTLDYADLPDKLLRDVRAMQPLAWGNGVLTLHAPAYLARRKSLAGELVQRLAPVSPAALVEVRIVNGQ